MGSRVSEAQVISLVYQQLMTLDGVTGIKVFLGAENVGDSAAPVAALAGEFEFTRVPDGGASSSDQDERVDIAFTVECSCPPGETRLHGMLAVATLAEKVAMKFHNLTLSGSNHVVELITPAVSVHSHVFDQGEMGLATVACLGQVRCDAARSGPVVDYLSPALPPDA